MPEDRLVKCANCGWIGALSELNENLTCPQCDEDELVSVIETEI